MKIEINLWELMAKKKITAVKLSSISGIAPVNISKIKNGKTASIGLSTIAKLLTVFECEPNDLFKIIKD